MHAVVWAMARAEVGRIKGKKFGARIERIETGGKGKWRDWGSGFKRANFSPRYLLLFARNWNCFAKFYVNCVLRRLLLLQNQFQQIGNIREYKFFPRHSFIYKGRGTNNLNKELNSFFISIEFRVNLSQAWPKSCKML